MWWVWWDLEHQWDTWGIIQGNGNTQDRKLKAQEEIIGRWEGNQKVRRPVEETWEILPKGKG